MKFCTFLFVGLFLAGCGSNSSSNASTATKSAAPPQENKMAKEISSNPKIPDAAKRAILGNAGPQPGAAGK